MPDTKTQEDTYTGPCGTCGEEVTPETECKCPGSSFCTCEFEHHHRGCCEDYEDLVNHWLEDNPGKADWDIVGAVDGAVLDAHDCYLNH